VNSFTENSDKYCSHSLNTHLGGGIAGGKCDILIFRCNSDITRCETFHMP